MSQTLYPKHFDGKRFFNPDAEQARGLRDFLRWIVTNRPERSPRFVEDVMLSVPPQRVAGPEMRVTLVNHSTVLLQTREWNMLTDPIWSERASPFGFIGPRRRRRPGVRKEDLPALDIVLLSHNHYDHLDMPTLRWLAQERKPVFLVPLGVARLLRSQGIGPVHELDWGDSFGFQQTTIHSVPAFHFSARSAFDRNRALWCGYAIASRTLTYFAADTGFGEHFSWIKEALGSPRLALLPIGSYAPRWFMSPIHMGPDEAIRAQQILGARTAVAIHHGTFQLGEDSIDTPRREILAQAPDSFVVLANGESLDIL